MNMTVKRFLLAAAICVAGCVAAFDLFVFSADGVTAGSAERELPSQGYDRVTGRVVVGLHARTDLERAACGWWRVIPTERPEAQSNEVWGVGGYDFGGGCATQKWSCTWRKVKPVKYSRLSIYAALAQLGKWETAETWMKEQGLYTAFMLAQEISSDHPQFVAVKSQVAAVLGLTDAQVDAILKECILK
jgi:hypothetical protein